SGRELELHLSPARYRTGLQKKQSGSKNADDEFFASRFNKTLRYIWKRVKVPDSQLTLWFMTRVLLHGHHYDSITKDAARKWTLNLPESVLESIRNVTNQRLSTESLPEKQTGAESLQQDQELEQLLVTAVLSTGEFCAFGKLCRPRPGDFEGNKGDLVGGHLGDEANKEATKVLISNYNNIKITASITEKERVELLQPSLAISANMAFQNAVARSCTVDHAAVLNWQGQHASATATGAPPLHERITFLTGPPGSGKSVQALTLLLRIEDEASKLMSESAAQQPEQVLLRYHTTNEKLRNEVRSSIEKHYEDASHLLPGALSSGFTSRIEVHSGPDGLTQSLSDEDSDDDDLALAAEGRPTDGGARDQLLST
ncbi:unnamed protein product, partial [Amoebophrya sp. A25]